MIIEEIDLSPGKYSVRYSGQGNSESDFKDTIKSQFRPEPDFLRAFKAFSEVVGPLLGFGKIEERRVDEADVDKQKAYAMLDKELTAVEEAIIGNISIKKLKFNSKNGESTVQIKGELLLRNDQSISFDTPPLVYNQEYAGLAIEIRLEELVMEVKKQAVRYVSLCNADKQDLFTDVDDYEMQVAS